ncbi:MAG: tetratricopeptide repeat protein [Chloroflexi bacterium]|nr:tetratricopeptide repeat protein [Chloroflexota bacterium]
MIERGDRERAVALFEESRQLNRERGDRHGISWSLRRLGIVAASQGQLDRASALLRASLGLLWELRDKTCTTWCLSLLASVCADRSLNDRAVRLLGAAQALRNTIGVSLSSLSPRERLDHDRRISSLRTTLGEDAFARPWAKGQTMAMEQAVAYALDEPASA